ncbi:MAG: exo-alpha-sialidase [Planctomycetes bacterium]|nr:exo-alpha-sialidase [Planctomycetota bacterium]
MLAPMAERGYEMNTRESSGFWNRFNGLFALCGQYRQEVGHDMDYLECKSDIYAWDAGQWKHTGVQIADYLGFEPPRLLSTGEYLITGHDQNCKLLMLFGGKDSLGDWRRVEIPPPADKHFLLEPNFWEDTNGTIHVVIRDDSSSHRLYYTASTDGGKTFPAPVKTDIPDARSRISTGILGDGRLYLCGNAGLLPDGTGKPLEGSGFAKRIPLTLAVGTVDGKFEKVYSIRSDETKGRWAASIPSNGMGATWGYQYPNVCEHDGFLYIAHSVNKEDIVVARVALADL